MKRAFDLFFVVCVGVLLLALVRSKLRGTA